MQILRLTPAAADRAWLTVERVSHVASGVRVSGRARVRVYLECPVGLGTGALTQHSVLRGSMNSERPPERASSTPTGPGGSEGLREGPGYF